MLWVLYTICFTLLPLCSELYQHLSVYNINYEKDEENDSNIHDVLCKSYYKYLITYSLLLNIEIVFITG